MNHWGRILFIGLFAACVSPAQSQRGDHKNIILIGWDGAQRAHVKEALGRGELPHLAAMVSEGRLVDIDIKGTTDTKAGWAQILSGYEAKTTGVYSNSKYGPIPKGYTIFERLEQHFGKENIVTGAVIGKKGNIDSDGARKVRADRLRGARARKLRATGEAVVEQGQTYYLVPAKPYFHTREAVDVFINGLKLDTVVAMKALEFLDQYKSRQFFLFVHFAEVDHSGHQFGENSRQYTDALISADRWTGTIVKKLTELNLSGRTLMYVTADHGFDEGQRSHRNAPFVILATNDPAIVRSGERVDIGPTILDRMGVPLQSIQPLLDGVSLAKPAAPSNPTEK